MIYTYIELDDHDFHGADCECGNCNSNGKSYGAAIYDVTSFRARHIDDIAPWVQEALKDQDPLNRVYAPSELGAIEKAADFCTSQGWTEVGTATHQEIIDDLMGSLRGLVGPEGYLTVKGVCECDNTHTQNHTVCRICRARYYYETVLLS